MLTYPVIRFCNRSPEEGTAIQITQRFPRCLLGLSGTLLALVNYLQRADNIRWFSCPCSYPSPRRCPA